MAKKIYQTNSEIQTFNLGKKLASQLCGGEILALSGPLGAGKTVLVKGLAAGLGVKEIITSPTFVVMKVYPVRHTAAKDVSPAQKKIKRLVHIDCYRVNEPQAILDIGAAEYFRQPDTVTVIEWAEYLKPILPRKKINLTIKFKNFNQRQITVK